MFNFFYFSIWKLSVKSHTCTFLAIHTTSDVFDRGRRGGVYTVASGCVQRSIKLKSIISTNYFKLFLQTLNRKIGLQPIPVPSGYEHVS